jgi:hypothetical protein
MQARPKNLPRIVDSDAIKIKTRHARTGVLEESVEAFPTSEEVKK